MSHLKEEWKPVVGYEGWYEVSSHGQVKRVHPYLTSRIGVSLKQNHCRKGYRQVCLSMKNVRRTRNVHSLVAAAFLGPRAPDCVVNHKDGQKQNNHLSNLEYISSAANTKHAIDLDLHTPGYKAAKFYWQLGKSGVTQATFALGLALAASMQGIDLRLLEEA